MQKAKIITMCGSVKFLDKINFYAEKLELEGNCILSIIYHTKENIANYTTEELELLGRLHKQKIDMADAIFIVNVNGNIGSSTQNEIEYAKSKGKEILYLEPLEM